MLASQGTWLMKSVGFVSVLSPFRVGPWYLPITSDRFLLEQLAFIGLLPTVRVPNTSRVLSYLVLITNFEVCTYFSPHFMDKETGAWKVMVGRRGRSGPKVCVFTAHLPSGTECSPQLPCGHPASACIPPVTGSSLPYRITFPTLGI